MDHFLLHFGILRRSGRPVIKVLFVLWLMSISMSAVASHVSSAEISYRAHTSIADRYIVTLVVFTDCGANIDPETSYDIIYRAGTCSPGGTVIALPKGQPIDVSPSCNANGSTCSGGTGPGIFRTVYEAQVTLPTACLDWRFSWEDCNRSGNISTVQNPQTTCIFIEARLNSILASGNTSPQFGNDPVTYLCTGQTSNISNAAFEPDNDSIAYSLVPPKSGLGSFLTYVPGYSATQPIPSSPASMFGQATGQLTLTPTQNIASLTAVEAREYRNGILVGTSMRDLQLTSYPCSGNAQPTLSGIDGTTSTSMEACAGETISFFIIASDPDAGQTLDLNLDNLPLGIQYSTTTLTNGNVRIDLQWASTANLSGIKTFTVMVSDGYCPISASQAQTFSITFNRRPMVELGTDTIIDCPQPKVINAYPTSGGTPPFTYTWNTGDVSQLLFATDTGLYIVEVKDAKGCTNVKSDSIHLVHDFVPIVSKLPRCPGESFRFKDKSRSLDGDTVVSWLWDFGDGTTYVGETPPPHDFPVTDTIYIISMTVTDENGCTYTGRRRVLVFEPEIILTKTDSCAGLVGISFYLEYNTAEFYPIGRDSVGEVIYGSIGIFSDELIHNLSQTVHTRLAFDGRGFPFDNLADPFVSSSGPNDYRIKFDDLNGCKFIIDTTVYAHPYPRVGFKEGSGTFDVCDRSDSTLTAFAIPRPDTVPYSFYWYNNIGLIYQDSGLTDSLILPMSVPFTDSSTYNLNAINDLGCIGAAPFEIHDPLEFAEFTRDSYCSVGDTVFFLDSAWYIDQDLRYSPFWPITGHEYSFGDGDSSFVSDPFHLYQSYGQFEINYTVTDSTGCTATYTDSIFTALPPSGFDIGDTALCHDQPLEYFSPPMSNIISSWTWAFGNGAAVTIREDSLRNGLYQYPSPGIYMPSLTIGYNKGECSRSYDTTIQVYPEPRLDVNLLTGQCIDTDSTRFALVQTSGVFPLTSYQWVLGYRQFGTAVYLYDTLAGTTFTTAYPEPGRVRSIISLMDSFGCSSSIDTIINVSRVSPPFLTASGLCANDVSLTNVPVVDIYENQVTFIFDFGDGTQSSSVFRGETIRHKYPSGGTYNVTLHVYDDFGCTDSYDTTVTVIDYPFASFTADTVCNGIPVSYINRSSATGPTGILVGNDWAFGDGDTSSLTQPTHLYGQAGTFPTRLIVTDSNACTDTATVNILVRKLPMAGFDAVGEPFYAMDPVMFLDRADSTVIEWNWLFGDGDSLITDLSQDPFHTYMTIDSFTVLQVVTDAFGCRDTARKLIDMNIYVALPNAFSPNGDGRNDLFHLLYPRERKDALALDAFRVYNRYGETVFDANGDMESGWDGSFNGKMQEPGVFLYFAKLQTRYQEEIILEGQVTLLK